MRLRITNAIYDVAGKRLEALFSVGAFPEVNYKHENGWKSYNMIEHSMVVAKFMKIMDIRMKEKKLDERLGVFTRQHSAAFLAKLEEIANEICEADVRGQQERFHTMWD